MKNSEGFTLIEIVVVVAIISLLSVVLVGAIVVARRATTEATHAANLRTTRAAFEKAYSRTRTYPCLTCNAWVGHPTILGLIDLTSANLIDTGHANCQTTYPKYGVGVWGKNNAGWATISAQALAQGVDTTGKDILLGQQNYNCSAYISFTALP